LAVKLPEWAGKLEASLALVGGTGGFAVFCNEHEKKRTHLKISFVAPFFIQLKAFFL
jgi:hypothetical protein